MKITRKPAISVIIPVYNSDLYLKECVDSILKQSFSDIEILIIDDGSTDSSWQLIQNYSSQYKNIHGYQQQRKRQGAARNLGLSHAQGEYISFVDSDDMLPKDAYHAMYHLAEKHESDFVTGIKKSFNKQRRWLPGRKLSWITIQEHKEYFTHTQANRHLTDLPELLVDISVCNKLIRRSLLEEHHLRFVERSAGEDIDFMTRLYVCAKSITIIPQVVYHYCSRPSSRTSRIQPEFFEDRVRIIENLELIFQAEGILLLYHVLVVSELRKLVQNRLVRVITNSTYDEQILIFQTIRRLLEKIDESKITNSDIDLTPLSQIRILMLYHGEFDALIAFTTQSENKRFMHLLDDNVKDQLFPLLDSFYLNKSKPSGESITPVMRLKWLCMGILLRVRKGMIVSNVLTRRNCAILYYFLLLPYFVFNNRKKTKNNIWLIDERVSASAQDNSYAFYKYLKTMHPSLQVYYVIDKNSPDLERVLPLGSIIYQYSLQHAFIVGLASILISTDRFESLAYPFIRFPNLLRNTYNVFLQHGVSGNKTTTYSKRNYPFFSSVIVCSENEKRMFVETYGFQKEEVHVTGFSRFDQLSTKKNTHPTNKILIASTWRKWLKESKLLYSSKYFYYWCELLQSQRLADLLERNDAYIYFQPHFNLMPFINEFKGMTDRIIIQDQDFPLQQHIIKCDLLITDYSSVMYDFYYQEKPVICYMFDRDEWEKQLDGPPLIDFDQDLPSDIVYNVDAVVDSLKEYMDRRYLMKEHHIPQIDYFIKNRDHANCARIYQSILQATGIPHNH